MILPNYFSEFEPNRLGMDNKPDSVKELPNVKQFCSMIDQAEGFSQVWEIVKQTVKVSLGEHRKGMLLFLDDLPLNLGAYHSVGTNNIVLNRSLLNIVQSVTQSKTHVNAFVYSILTHEYLHALGHLSETKVRSLVYEISKQCFGPDHITVKLAKETPWILLKGVPLHGLKLTKEDMELIKDLEKPNHRYIV